MYLIFMDEIKEQSCFYQKKGLVLFDYSIINFLQPYMLHDIITVFIIRDLDLKANPKFRISLKKFPFLQMPRTCQVIEGVPESL